jgi:hypothetical protein
MRPQFGIARGEGRHQQPEHRDKQTSRGRVYSEPGCRSRRRGPLFAAYLRCWNRERFGSHAVNREGRRERNSRRPVQAKRVLANRKGEAESRKKIGRHVRSWQSVAFAGNQVSVMSFAGRKGGLIGGFPTYSRGIPGAFPSSSRRIPVEFPPHSQRLRRRPGEPTLGSSGTPKLSRSNCSSVHGVTSSQRSSCPHQDCTSV